MSLAPTAPLPKNVSWCRARQQYRIEMRVLPRKSRTRRVRTLEEALELREAWAAERREAQALREAESIVRFHIDHRKVLVDFA